MRKWSTYSSSVSSGQVFPSTIFWIALQLSILAIISSKMKVEVTISVLLSHPKSSAINSFCSLTKKLLDADQHVLFCDMDGAENPLRLESGFHWIWILKLRKINRSSNPYIVFFVALDSICAPACRLLPSHAATSFPEPNQCIVGVLSIVVLL
jgi:hypothetical protein